MLFFVPWSVDILFNNHQTIAQKVFVILSQTTICFCLITAGHPGRPVPSFYVTCFLSCRFFTRGQKTKQVTDNNSDQIQAHVLLYSECTLFSKRYAQFSTFSTILMNTIQFFQPPRMLMLRCQQRREGRRNSNNKGSQNL